MSEEAMEIKPSKLEYKGEHARLASAPPTLPLDRRGAWQWETHTRALQSTRGLRSPVENTLKAGARTPDHVT